MRWAMLIATALVSAGLLYLIVTGVIVPVDTRALGQYWERFDYLWGIFGVLIFAINYPVNAWRFAFISSKVGRYQLDYVPSLAVVWFSSFLTTILPSSLAMDVGRIALLRQFGYTDTTGGARIVLVDRAVGLLTLVIISILSLALTIVFFDAPDLFLWLLGGGVAAMAGVYAFSRLPVPKLTSLELVQRVWSLVDNLAHLHLVPRNFLTISLIGLVNAVSFGLVFWILAHAMDVSMPLLPLLLASPLIIVVNNLPFFYQGFGGRELAVVALLEPMMAVNATELIAISIASGSVVWICNFAGLVLFPYVLPRTKTQGN